MYNLSSSEFMFLLISHLKLKGIDKVDVVQLCYALTDLYYVNKYQFLMQDFQLRKDKDYKDIVDIDGALIDLYVFNYLDENRNIKLDINTIKNRILDKYDKNLNELISNLADDLIKKFELYNSSEDNFVFDNFFKCDFKRKK